MIRRLKWSDLRETAMKVLEVNVDDLHSGGVYSLIKNVVINKPSDLTIDLAAVEHFENPENIRLLKQHGTSVFFIGYEGNKIKKQLVCYQNLKRIIRENGYDCVHIHSDVANKELVYGLAAKHAGANRIIMHSHAAGVDGQHRRWKLRYHTFSRLFLPNIATDFVACSDLAAKWMFPDVAPDKITIIRNGVDLQKFRFNPAVRHKVRGELGIADDTYLIGHVGRFAYQKNHHFLIHIFEEYVKEHADSRLLLIGEGPMEKEIRELVESKALTGKVIFYGASSHVDQMLSAMDVFVLPSHFEGLPIVGVEAQAAGLPVLFSDQITREAKLTEAAQFLPIDETSTQAWIRCLDASRSVSRSDTYEIMKKQKYDIADTVEQFLELYEER